MRRIWIAVVLAAVLLAGCAPEPESTPWPTVTETATPKPTSTRRIFPSPTRYKTQTPVPSLTPTKTITPTLTSTPPPFPTPENARGLYPESISPSKKWSAWRVNCSSLDMTVSDCFVFVNISGTKFWSFAVENLVPEGFANENYVSVTHWSIDNRFVYLVASPTAVEWYFGTPVNRIIKFSLVNGLHSYIITPRQDETQLLQAQVFQYAFSNDSQQLVYGDQPDQSVDLTIFDLYNGDVDFLSVIAEPCSPFGDFSWSPNNRFFVFSVAESVTGIYSSDDFSVFLVDIEDLYAKRVYSHGVGWLSFPEWISDREIQYMYDGPSGHGDIILNIETGEVTEVEE